MKNFISTAQSNPTLLSEAASLADTYWQSFQRDTKAGRAFTEAGPKVILPARVLAINLFNTLDETLGAMVSNLVLYGIGKSWGSFNADHFKEWAARHKLEGGALRYGALFFPTQVGLAPRFDLVELEHEGVSTLVVRVNNSVLSEIRHKNGLDTEPAHWLISGWLAGCMGTELGIALEGRAIPNSGETTYHVLLAPAEKIGQINLGDEIWLKAFDLHPSISVQM
ncbi:hypothetical protein [Meiothermus granaticius]|uniref:Uncharacterized protein n=1 Tax=Meiothermus granaticius NBRC 107808 TaxID=1227551 RepID=A0A399FBV1_9DEIN|nr:hypothetical protein [Meiothermus granaticius]MCL6525433.1 hypothetical protein [Thermaceae bacterium]RIH92749.1 hypothetical protein Mgrana_01287 [Meiothermus granaticius NBRC 107808]GEM87328.1 hypothetical protein MGR01S_19530 [Meiothermus granaticius NBRC 107808]